MGTKATVNHCGCYRVKENKLCACAGHIRCRKLPSQGCLLVDILMYWLVTTVSIACYLNSLSGDFVHDDLVAVTSNPDVLGKTTLSELFLNDFWGKAMSEPTSHKSYRPLTTLTFRLNMSAGGQSVLGYHLLNVVLHATAVTLFMQLCKEVLAWRREATITAALFFASHPIHTEAVSSIVGRADVLCCVLYLTSLIAYVRCSKDTNGITRKSITWFTISLISASLSLLAKEHGVTVVAVSLSYQVLLSWEQTIKKTKKAPQGLRTSPSTIRYLFIQNCTDSRCLIVLVTLLILLGFRGWMLHGTLPQFSNQDNPAAFSSSLLTRFLTYSYLSAFNAWLLLAPITLSYDWQMGSIPLVESLWDCRNIATISLAVIMATITWHMVYGSQGTERRRVFLSLSLLVFPFLPASNLFVTVGFVVAERVLYIPRLMERGPLIAWICRLCTCLLLSLFVMKTVTRNSVWLSREALFKSGLESVPNNAKVHYNYANLRKDNGDVETAIIHYRTALRLWPDHASAHNNLGTLLNDTDKAEQHFKIALQIDPWHPRAHFNLANLYSKRGQQDIAVKLLCRAIELDSNFVGAYSALASLYAEQGKKDEAEKLHLLALSLDPENADCFNNYGAFLQKTGRIDEAVKQYQKAIAIDPNHTVALVNAAKTLKSMKHNVEAEDLYNRALTIQEDPDIMDNLGLLYTNTGRSKDARRVYDDLREKYPEHVNGKVHYSQLLIQDRSYQQAEHILLSVVEDNSSHREALHLLATLYNQSNKTTEALDYILRALAVCNFQEKICARMHAEHGDILKDLNDFDSAEHSYHLALMLDPNLAHAHLNLAVIHHLRGNYTAAHRHYQAAYYLDSNHKLLLENMEKLRKTLYKTTNDNCWRGGAACHLE
ncbi:protein O-mannosyl-transferase TMTC1-like isoform X2 [Centruroides vittatus]|uniref:protein O-mannosyl-transferase TMTC1-like isoform X2 n=1 Tax=Centruroides vittatus TaxID=120091 RepID=UPI003510CDCF